MIGQPVTILNHIAWFAPWTWKRRWGYLIAGAVALLVYVLAEAPLHCIIETSSFSFARPFYQPAGVAHSVVYAPMRPVHFRSPTLRQLYKAAFIATCRLTEDPNSYPEFTSSGWRVSYTEYSTF